MLHIRWVGSGDEAKCCMQDILYSRCSSCHTLLDVYKLFSGASTLRKSTRNGKEMVSYYMHMYVFARILFVMLMLICVAILIVHGGTVSLKDMDGKE